LRVSRIAGKRERGVPIITFVDELDREDRNPYDL